MFFRRQRLEIPGGKIVTGQLGGNLSSIIGYLYEIARGSRVLQEGCGGSTDSSHSQVGKGSGGRFHLHGWR